MPEHTVMRDCLLRPGPAVSGRTVVNWIRDVVTVSGTFRVPKNCELVQIPGHYLIQDIETGGIVRDIPLDAVMWLEPEPMRAGYYDDWKKKWINYDEL